MNEHGHLKNDLRESIFYPALFTAFTFAFYGLIAKLFGITDGPVMNFLAMMIPVLVFATSRNSNNKKLVLPYTQELYTKCWAGLILGSIGSAMKLSVLGFLFATAAGAIVYNGILPYSRALKLAKDSTGESNDPR